MTEARGEMLGRIRRALASAPAGEEVPVPRGYRTRLSRDPAGLVDLFAERVADYRATVYRVPEDEVGGAVTAALTRRSARSVVVPEGFPVPWLPEARGLHILRDTGPLSVDELDGADAVLTTATVAIAETGTLVLDHGPGQGRRALTLVPDYHLCVVRAEQIAGGVPEGLAVLDPARPLTFVSGPSATSDIELNRVEGVHGPRTLEVIIAS